jgi:hypothetical protein
VDKGEVLILLLPILTANSIKSGLIKYYNVIKDNRSIAYCFNYEVWFKPGSLTIADIPLVVSSFLGHEAIARQKSNIKLHLWKLNSIILIIQVKVYYNP